MCKYCKQIAAQYDIGEATVHNLITDFFRLREADGIYSLSIAPECQEEFFDVLGEPKEAP